MGREGCGAREALAAAAVVTPGRGNPRGFRGRWASRALALGSQLVRVSLWGTGSGFGGLCALGHLPQDPRLGAKLEGGGLPVVSLRTVRACASSCLAFQPPGRVGSSSGTWLARSRAAQCQGWEDSSGQQRGPGLRMPGRTCREAQCRLRRERSSVPELNFKDPHPSPLSS